MYKFVFQVSEKQMAGVLDMIEKYFGIRVTAQYVYNMLCKNRDLIHEVADNAYTDTYVRDKIADVIAGDVAQMPNWPLNCDSDKYTKKFYKRLKRGADKMGFKITWE